MASAKRYPQMCEGAAQRSSSAASFHQTVEWERVMGVNTDYLGHVEIVPNLNQAEYDYLHAFARSRRSHRPGGPYAVSPEDPHTGNGKREVERYNQIADGQPGYWCQWVPCPHGCCLVWNGHEKFYARRRKRTKTERSERSN
jgi:hypothetical protein